MASNPELDVWNGRFSQPSFVFGTEPNAFLAAQGPRLKPGQTALAVADGEGRNGVWLARQGLDVLSLDFAPAAQAKARQLAAQHGVQLKTELADLAQWTWPVEQFDVVVAIFIQFSGPPLRDAIFRGMKTALKRGGLLILQGYRPEQIAYKTGGPPNIENMYTEAVLREAFGDLRILHLAAHDDMVSEGGGHHGMSALIDMVAEKP
jgi:cyclopropane fatty-acyl-phospholipid synthase-like methyltransferase